MPTAGGVVHVGPLFRGSLEAFMAIVRVRAERTQVSVVWCAILGYCGAVAYKARYWTTRKRTHS